ncbi:MAG: aminotransferase class IV [Candidatus Omnitrophica bacterium]|nr:aminotransferase class IV [Candidatus Omnitrophota bacterium]
MDGKTRSLSSSDAALALDALDNLSFFETLRAYEGKIFRLEQHLNRLHESCRGAARGIASIPRLAAWARRSFKEAEMPEAILRLSIYWKNADAGALTLTVRPFAAYPTEWYTEGVDLKTVVPRRWPLKSQDPQIKASQFMNGVMAHLDARQAGARELLFLGEGKFVAEGSVSNVFIIKSKRLLTPHVASGILKGVTRGVILEAAARRQWDVLETFLTRHEFYTADECFITNTSSEVLPVVRIDGRRIGSGLPGEMTKILAQDFKKCLKSNARS